MFAVTRPFFILVETPLHAGSGADLGVVDLPIQRERHTGFPKIEASGLKGCFRGTFDQLTAGSGRRLALEARFPALKQDENRYRQAVNLVFGPEQGDLHAGALGFTDARLLLFPVRSARGVFAWTTCPAALHRLMKELALAKVSPMPPIPAAGTVPMDSDVLTSGDTVILEEYSFSVTERAETGELARWLSEHVLPYDSTFQWWQGKMTKSLVVLPDDDFRDFVTLATEVITRIKIDPATGTAKSGALFTEEYLPQESLLYSLALGSPIFGTGGNGTLFAVEGKEAEAVLDFWQTGIPAGLQLGGNSTIGKGLVRIRTWGGAQ